MKKRKLTALIGICAITAVLTVGCGSSNVEEITDTAVTPDDVEEDLVEEGEIDLSKGEQIAGFSNDTEVEEDDDEDSEDIEYSEDDSDSYNGNLFSDSHALDESGDTVFNFEADKTHMGSIPETAEMQVRAGDLNTARWESLKKYYDGNEADAQEEMDDLTSAPAVTDAALKKIEPYYPQIARYIQGSGITSYDMTLPYYEDEEEVDYDMYTSDYRTFYLSIYFKEDGSIESFDMFEEDLNDFDEADDEEDYDEEDEEIIIDDEE